MKVGGGACRTKGSRQAMFSQAYLDWCNDDRLDAMTKSLEIPEGVWLEMNQRMIRKLPEGETAPGGWTSVCRCCNKGCEDLKLVPYNLIIMIISL